MSDSQRRTTTTPTGDRTWSAPGPIALAAMVGVGAAVAMRSIGARRASSRAAAPQGDSAALRAYLRDHLTGSDAAYAVVDRLRQTDAGTSQGALFQDLYDQFTEERAIVGALVTGLGGSPMSLKRLSGQAVGGVLQTIAGGADGDLALFRTLESLAIGVQGKRLMWRALDTLSPALLMPSACTCRDLEALALDQWHRIEDHRRSLVVATFGRR